MARIFLVRDENSTLICRRRPRPPWIRPLPRGWRALGEFARRQPRPGRTPGDIVLIFTPAAALGTLVAAVAPPEVGVAIGGAALIAATRFAPDLRRRVARHLTGRRLARPDTVVLGGAAERAEFDRAVAVADSISQTWPELGGLIDVADAEMLLAEALWEVALLLGQRAELDAVLAGLTSAGVVPGRVQATGDAVEWGETLNDVRVQSEAVKATRARIQAELVRREASLRRAEQAGRDFIAERQMRRAIRAADETLRATEPGSSSSPVALDAGADLAEHTRSVLNAYRELTAGLRPE